LNLIDFDIEISAINAKGAGVIPTPFVLSAVNRLLAELWSKSKAAQEAAQVGQRQPNSAPGACA
jgi:hypothetical protein